jgi:hypothetical protein
MSLTLSTAEVEDAKCKYAETKRLALTKVVKAQATLNQFWILKYLEGFNNCAEKRNPKHSLEDLEVCEPNVTSAEGEDIGEEFVTE